MNVILAGMMGSGKTTVSRALSDKLGLEVVDTDAEIIAKHGRIADIFAKFGEEHFRDLETQTVREVCKRDGVIISTGGGCLLRAENRELFKNSGKIIYLRARLETLVARVEGDTERPLLQGGARPRLARLIDERAPIYEGAADLTIDTDDLTVDEVANKISELLK